MCIMVVVYAVSDTVIFDNTASWTRSKKLWYRVELHQTDEQTDAEVGLLHVALVSETSHL